MEILFCIILNCRFYLQKSKVLSFVDRGPPSWEQCPQFEKTIPVSGSTNVLQLSDDATSESRTDSVLEALTTRLIGNGQKEKRSSDGRGKDESDIESLEMAMYQTVRKKIEMINQSLTHVDHQRHDAESSSGRNSVSALSTLQVRSPDSRPRETSRRPDVVSLVSFTLPTVTGFISHHVDMLCIKSALNDI